MDWLEFSREWNIPVHHFFRRHVYTASRNKLSRPVATIITFFISALAHELVMGCITRKFRGYGFVAQMLQMPIVLVQRSKFVRSKRLLNNVLFWCSMISGLSMVSNLKGKLTKMLMMTTDVRAVCFGVGICFVDFGHMVLIPISFRKSSIQYHLLS